METKAIIETDELTKIYNGQIAVDHLSLKIEEGEIFCFLATTFRGGFNSRKFSNSVQVD